MDATKEGCRSIERKSVLASCIAGFGVSRREFIKVTAVSGLGITAGIEAWANSEANGAMPYRSLGRTGEKVSAIGLGGFHIGQPKEEKEGIRIIRTAIDRGITFMDNSW